MKQQKLKETVNKRLLHFWDEEHSLTALLVLLVVEMFIIIPSARAGQTVDLISICLFSFLLLAGLLTMARHRILQVISAVFVFSAILVRVARTAFGVSGLLEWDALLSILSVVGMIVVVLWQVYRPGPVTGHRVRGAIAAYLLIAILFAYGYVLIAALVPGSFQLPAWVAQTEHERAEVFFYFSIVSLTTVGFGDITAIHPAARSLVMMEALIGQLYPAILIARLVTLEIESRRK